MFETKKKYYTRTGKCEVSGTLKSLAGFI